MKHNKFFYVFLGVFLLLIVGCSNASESEGSKIVIQERIGQENEFEHFKEVSDNQTFQKAKDILEGLSWETAEITMANYPDYKFHFEGENEHPERIYDIYISLDTSTVEIFNTYETKYVILNTSESNKLLETIAGIRLDVEY